MLQTKEFIRRSAMDRRLSLNRRILNLGPKYPDKEQRMKQNRRQGFEDRCGYDQLTRWSSFPNTFKEPLVIKDSYNRNERRV